MLLPVSLFLFPKLKELGLRGLTLPLHAYLKDNIYITSNEDTSSMTYEENEDFLVGLGLVGVRLRLLTYMICT